MGKNILIGGAWPYANSSLHLGHLAGLLSGDVLARYYRLKGDNVLYVSGSDTHGTPITERARKENITPYEIASKYHEEFSKMFKDYNFSYDLYSKTFDEFHEKKVQELFKKLYDNGYIYEKLEKQAYCEHCSKFLQDRDIKLICPECGEETKGDQCDNCLHVPTTEELIHGNCIVCGSSLVEKENKVLYLKLSDFQKQIEEQTSKVEGEWRINARNETWKYLKQGLQDRAVTRDLNWGIEIPIPGYEDKRMYVWIDAVLGYLTDTMKLAEERGFDWQDFWKEGHNNKIYMCHGKDNIVFHSIILNGLLLGQNEDYHLVDTIVSAEYLNFNDQKFSKSKGIGMTAIEALEKYDSDSLRYHLISNGPEKKDTNFTIEDFENVHNTEIVNKFGNLVNRTLKFKGLTNIPNGSVDKDIENMIKETYDLASEDIENLEFKAYVQKVMDLVESANKYYDSNEPWKAIKEDESKFNNIIYTCSTIIANLAILFEPIMPEASHKLMKFMNIENPTWNYITAHAGLSTESVEPLFERYK
jgi:methionyl-tRNA synthetase